jgi:hypothetical protein
MGQAKPILDQLNIVSGDMAASIAFYQRLGVEIPDQAVWRTASGAHHASAHDSGIDFDLTALRSRRSGIRAGAAATTSRAASSSAFAWHRGRRSMRPMPI